MRLKCVKPVVAIFFKKQLDIICNAGVKREPRKVDNANQNKKDNGMHPTHGPWTIGPNSKTIRPAGFNRIGFVNGGCVIAELFGKDRAANAHLFLAAQDMLYALEMAVTCHAGADEAWIDHARAAIATAKGEEPPCQNQTVN